jgi:2-polyprenyl-3-methyl-5-hydroxy-6-metoxy-1,4-benzoquinol methylase
MSATSTGTGDRALAARLEACRSIGDFLALWFEHPLLPAAQQRVFDAHYADYRRHFPPRMRALYARQTDELIALVRARHGCRMLEIGSGSGSESLWAAMLGAHVLGVDVRADRVAVARARQDVVERALGRSLDCRFEVRSLFDVTGQTVDVIWMEQALHHVEPRDAALDRIVTLLAPGGCVVVSEANAANPLLQLQLFLRRGWRTRTTFVDDAGQEHPYGNERVLRAATLVRALARRGICCESVRHFRVFPNHPLFDGTRRIEARLERLQLVPLLTHYNYVGRRES